MSDRAPSDTIKFATPFGSFFLHVARKNGAIVNVQISHQMKEPDAQVPVLIRAINDALRELAK